MWKSGLRLSAGMAGIDCPSPQHLKCHGQHGQKSPFCLQRSSARWSYTCFLLCLQCPCLSLPMAIQVIFWDPFIVSPSSPVRLSVRGLGPYFQFASFLRTGSNWRSRNSVPCLQSWLRSHRKYVLGGHILLLCKFISQRFQGWHIPAVPTLPLSLDPSPWCSSQWPPGVTSFLVSRSFVFYIFSAFFLGKTNTLSGRHS